jgi:hypothetical protein
MTIFHVITVVWGDEYTSLFLDTALPTQLTPGNLPRLASGTRSRYLVHTTAADAARIEAHPAWRRLTSVLPSELVIMPEDHQADGAIARMTRCHRQAIARGAQDDAGLIFLAPDIVMADGTLGHVGEAAAAGIRVLMCTGVRLAAETFLPAFQARVAQTGDAALAARALVALALDHLHPSARAAFADARPFTRKPAVIYWRVPGQGIVAHCLHLHPLFVHPERAAVPLESIDGGYLAEACPSLHHYAYLDDSDQGVVFELSRGDSKPIRYSPGLAPATVATFGGLRCDRMHRRSFRTAIRLKAQYDADQWRPVERRAAVFVRRVRVLFPVSRQLLAWQGWRDRTRRHVDDLHKTSRKRMKRAWNTLLKRAQRSLRNWELH